AIKRTRPTTPEQVQQPEVLICVESVTCAGYPCLTKQRNSTQFQRSSPERFSPKTDYDHFYPTNLHLETLWCLSALGSLHHFSVR
ncbi:MAG: hypothetical protein QF920_01320, partial [Verrucomicrobiota bacterium]|nr:hypothetical protein [Verrucomicrobiota bacterium]